MTIERFVFQYKFLNCTVAIGIVILKRSKNLNLKLY